MRRSGSIWWGTVLILFGLLFLLDNMRVLDLSEVLHQYWPLLLVLWGIIVLARRGEKPGTDATASPQPNVFSDTQGESSSDQLNQSNVFGDLRMRVQSRNFRGGSISTVFGDSNIDLSGSGLAEGEHELKLSGVFGDTTITLPKDVPYAVDAHTVFGEVRVKDQHRSGITSALTYQSPDYAAGAKKLKIRASQVFGEIIVRE